MVWFYFDVLPFNQLSLVDWVIFIAIVLVVSAAYAGFVSPVPGIIGAAISFLPGAGFHVLATIAYLGIGFYILTLTHPMSEQAKARMEYRRQEQKRKRPDG